MKFVVRALRRARRKYIPDTSAILPPLRRAYAFLLAHSTALEERGIPIDIGGYGYFRLHPKLAVGTYNFEEWGTAHNAGFSQWIEACRGKKAVFDIGAHIGLYALPASKVIVPQGRLYAFEPAQVNRELLKRHIEYNRISNIEVVPDLVGDERKQDVEFFETESAHGMNTIAQESVAHKNIAHPFRKVLRKQIRLDDFCHERGIVPEVIKIDVEGGELKVIQGARKVFVQSHPLIFLSVHPSHLQHLGSSAEALYSVILELGYTAFNTKGNKVNELRKEEYMLRYD